MPLAVSIAGFDRATPPWLRPAAIALATCVHVLVLLIVFMVTAPMLAAGMRVDLPQAKAAQPLDPKEPVIITVARDAKLYVGRDEVARTEDLHDGVV